ncbi:MAG: hypothetical protein JSW11_12010 [Candidatus Heimdallarchaeota archaeon]|nr:MAG: hypothetical protein JSW11_12010 [Candidatus Heimdallarchaeota archaeon]
MKKQDDTIQKQSSSSYIIAIPDGFTLTNIPNLEELLTKVTAKLGIPKTKFTNAELAQALDGFKTESDIWMKEMSTIHWIVFSILQYQLVIHEFSTEPGNERIFNIMARGKQQRIEQILGGQYNSL